MEITKFLENVEKFKPNREMLLVTFGYSEDSVDLIMRHYSITKKENPNPDSKLKFLRFLQSYDLTKWLYLEITFNKDIEEFEDGYVIGCVCDGFPLVLGKNNELYAVDFVDYEQVMWGVCKNADNFLDVISIILEYDSYMLNSSTEEIYDLKVELLKKIEPLVGGEFYLEYYMFIYQMDLS